MKNLYIHVQNNSWKVRTHDDKFDKDVVNLQKVLTKEMTPSGTMIGGCWIPVYSDSPTLDAHIYLTAELKKLAILETIVE